MIFFKLSKNTKKRRENLSMSCTIRLPRIFKNQVLILNTSIVLLFEQQKQYVFLTNILYKFYKSFIKIKLNKVNKFNTILVSYTYSNQPYLKLNISFY